MAASQQLETALKKERERSRALEHELEVLRGQLQEAAVIGREVDQARVQEQQRRASEKKAAEEQLSVARQQIQVLNATLAKHHYAAQGAKSHHGQIDELSRENHDLYRRLTSAECRAQSAENRLKQMEIALAEKVEVLAGHSAMLSGTITRTFDSLEQKFEQRLNEEMTRLASAVAEDSAKNQRNVQGLAQWFAGNFERHSKAQSLQLDAFAKVMQVLAESVQSSMAPLRTPSPPPAPTSPKVTAVPPEHENR